MASGGGPNFRMHASHFKWHRSPHSLPVPSSDSWRLPQMLPAEALSHTNHSPFFSHHFRQDQRTEELYAENIH